jgi:hypothetical protein
MSGVALRLLAALALLAAAAARAEDGYVSGKDICYYFNAPSGWELDSDSGKEQGIPMVFYPRGSSWADASTVIYSRNQDFVAGAKSDQEKIQGQVERVLTHFRNDQSPDSKAKKLRSIKAAHGAQGELWQFTGDRFGNTELVAYFVAAHTVNYFVMTSRSKDDYERSAPALGALADSYREGNDCVPCSAKGPAASCGGQPAAVAPPKPPHPKAEGAAK